MTNFISIFNNDTAYYFHMANSVTFEMQIKGRMDIFYNRLIVKKKSICIYCKRITTEESYGIYKE